MSGTAAGVIFLALLVVALAAVHVPFGDYMYRVYSSQKHSRTERFIYRLIGASPDAEQSWATYARSLLAFSAVSVVFTAAKKSSGPGQYAAPSMVPRSQRMMAALVPAAASSSSRWT